MSRLRDETRTDSFISNIEEAAAAGSECTANQFDKLSQGVQLYSVHRPYTTYYDVNHMLHNCIKLHCILYSSIIHSRRNTGRSGDRECAPVRTRRLSHVKFIACRHLITLLSLQYLPAAAVNPELGGAGFIRIS